MPWLASAIRIKDRATALRLALDPDFQLGQCYRDGDLTITRGYTATSRLAEPSPPGRAVNVKFNRGE